MYIDGIDATATLTFDDRTDAVSTNTQPLYIGERGDELGGDCRIACVGIHNVILTAGEIKTAMRRGWTPRGLVFFSLVGHDADLSGSARTPTVSGTSIVDGPPIGPPFGFDLGWMGAFTAAGAVAGHPAMRRWGGVPHLASHYGGWN